MKIWLGRGRYKRELEMVQELVDAGHELVNIAAAAIKIARADEKQRPIAEVSEVKDIRKPEREYGRGGGDRKESFGRRGLSERSGRPERGGDSKRRGDSSHEEGMIRMKINKGKMHGVRPSDIVGTIAFHANIPGYTIGKIRIDKKFTFVDVPEDAVDQILKQNGNYRISVDKIAWAMKDQMPLKAVAVGGRQIPSEGGDIFDHFEVNYEYKGGARAFMGCRQQTSCHNENNDYLMGEKGYADIKSGRLEIRAGLFRLRRLFNLMFGNDKGCGMVFPRW